MTEQKVYKQGVVRAVLGCSKSQLDTWLKLRYIDPAVPARRAGHPAGYSVTNIAALRLINDLADGGLALKHASVIAKRCMEQPDQIAYIDFGNLKNVLFGLSSPPRNMGLCLVIDTKDFFVSVEEDLRDLEESK